MKYHVPEYIRSLVPYVPGKSIQETQREYNPPRIVKLASNENPLGPSPKALAAIQEALPSLQRYPDATGFDLKLALSKHYQALGISADQFTLGNGSNEVIDNLFRTFCISGDLMVMPQYSFIAYKISAQIHGVKALEVPVDSQFNFQVDAFLDSIQSNEKVRIAFLANPNNPTGSYVNHSQMQEIIQGLKKIRNGSVILVLDYAYWEYVNAADLPEPMSLLKEYPSSVVLRTFSKAHGLAGLRVGYAVASSEIISYLEKVRQPFNLNSLALKGAEAALEDHEFIQKSTEVNREGMTFWSENLKRLKIPFLPSQGNFLYVKIKEGTGMGGLQVFQACLEKGVVLRPLANYGLDEGLRISIGTEPENRAAVNALEACIRR